VRKYPVKLRNVRMGYLLRRGRGRGRGEFHLKENIT